MRKIFRNCGRALAVVATVVLFLAGRPGDAGAAPVRAGADLYFVPADAVAVVSVHVADLWKHPAGKAALQKVTEGLPDAVQSIRGLFGVRPEDVDRVTLFVPALGREPHGGETDPLVAVTTLNPYDQKAILAAAAPNAKERKVKGRSLYVNDRGPSFVFLDNHTYLMDRPERLEAFLKRTDDQTERPLGPVLKWADKHLVVAGVDVASMVRMRPLPDDPKDMRPEITPFLPLFKVRLVTLIVDLDDKLRATAQATFPMEADAKDRTAAVDAALDLFRAAFENAVKELPALEDAPKLMTILKDVQTAMRAARAEQKAATVEVNAAMAVDPTATTAAATEVVESIRKKMKLAALTKDLKELALAVHDYASANDSKLPAAAVYDKDGKPLLSWRVTLLPYIGQEGLYKEFHLDEPWDGEHNKKLLEKMPTTFAPPDSQAFKDHETHYQAVVGKDTVWRGVYSIGNIPDGTSNTILFVEAKQAVPWTKPEDLPLDSAKLTSKLGDRVEGKFMAALCDGSVRFFPLKMKEDVLRVWAGTSNGEIRPDPEK